MTGSRSSILFLASMFVASSAFAGSGDITATVAELGENFSFGNTATGFTSFVGYSVQLENKSTNTSNKVRFTGTTSADTGSAATFAFVTGTGAPVCFATSSSSASKDDGVSCEIGQMPSGALTNVFYVFFKAPNRPAAASATLTFSGLTWFAEGGNGPNSPPQNSSTPWSPVNVALGTISPNNIKSAVPKVQNKLSFFTAQNPPGQLEDQITTVVGIPSLDQQKKIIDFPSYTPLDYAQVKVQEAAKPTDDLDCVNAKNFVRCYTTQIEIRKDSDSPTSLRLEFPPSGPYLTLDIRIGAEAIRAGFKKTDARIKYIDENGEVDVGLCINGFPLPCAESIEYYKKKGPTPDLDGKFQVIIRHNHNGTARIF